LLFPYFPDLGQQKNIKECRQVSNWPGSAFPTLFWLSLFLFAPFHSGFSPKIFKLFFPVVKNAHYNLPLLN